MRVHVAAFIAGWMVTQWPSLADAGEHCYEFRVDTDPQTLTLHPKDDR